MSPPSHHSTPSGTPWPGPGARTASSPWNQAPLASGTPDGRLGRPNSAQEVAWAPAAQGRRNRLMAGPHPNVPQNKPRTEAWDSPLGHGPTGPPDTVGRQEAWGAGPASSQDGVGGQRAGLWVSARLSASLCLSVLLSASQCVCPAGSEASLLTLEVVLPLSSTAGAP